MNAYRIETTLTPVVNVYSLRETPILEYTDPFEPVAQDDWEINQTIMLNNPCLSTRKDAAITHGTYHKSR